MGERLVQIFSLECAENALFNDILSVILNRCLDLGRVHIQRGVGRLEPIAPVWKRAGGRDVAWKKFLCSL